MGDMIQVSQGCLEAREKMLGDARGRGAVRYSRWYLWGNLKAVQAERLW